jgi:GNAT superfamily N-acetyltransferase
MGHTLYDALLAGFDAGGVLTFADLALARRIEGAQTAQSLGCAPGDAAALEIGGGCAIFAGVDSPLTQAVGLGLHGPVSSQELDEVEEFFRSRGGRPVIEVCPLADTGFIETLGERGYRVSQFDNVLARGLTGVEIVLTPRVRRATPEESDLWAHTVGRGFFERTELSGEEMDVGRWVFRMPGALCFLGSSDGGTPAGGAALGIREGLAMMFADGVARPSRRLGLHKELIAARLNEALARGCDVAAAATAPASASQRNFERLGFQVVYTRVTLSK